ncbi:hypothetical protein LIER_41190 [Lithospermum erythrorhizon]|uniref:Uncharacterized protein n=1 Tax=Lithospermum erythrorhizon TaxID=34254 RepID=A0AAV3R5E8_LITER
MERGIILGRGGRKLQFDEGGNGEGDRVEGSLLNEGGVYQQKGNSMGERAGDRGVLKEIRNDVLIELNGSKGFMGNLVVNRLDRNKSSVMDLLGDKGNTLNLCYKETVESRGPTSSADKENRPPYDRIIILDERKNNFFGVSDQLIYKKNEVENSG